MKGFFSLTTVQKAPQALVPKCGTCGLYKGCNSPKMEWSGEGRMGVLIVGEAPGEREDQKGTQFVGKTGHHLARALRNIGIDMRGDCWLTNALICHPPGNKIADDRMVDWCRPNLTKTIRELNPKVIIPLGGAAIRSLIGPLWKEDIGKVQRWIGWQIPSHDPNAWICPNWHPSFLVRIKHEVADRNFERDLAKAFALTKRPWKEAPDFESRVIVEMDPKKAAEHIMLFTECSKGPIAFDYETNCLRPWSGDAEIVCCSISDGRKSVSFPWMGPAIRAMQSFIRSPVPKSGWNIKFEESATRAAFGHGVRNWHSDGMLKTHWKDNRPGITSLKFQGYVKLGVGDYDSKIKPFLRAEGANRINRIKEVPILDLLKYCGMDSLLEAILTRINTKEEYHVGIVP